MADPVIEIDELTKSYRRGLRRQQVFAVKKLSLTVEPASIVAFVGPNGAGKTTTIQTLLGLLKPDSGTAKLFGAGTHPGVLKRVGYQPEVFHTYPFYTPFEALRFYGRMSGLSQAELQQAIPPLLDRMGLSDATDRKVSTFSKGMNQRLGLAQALLHNPDLLILDEPTSGLDPEGRRLVLEIIREERSRGRTIFLSSHILSDVERTCDVVFMIRKGEIVYTEQLSAFVGKTQEWEVEVLGWNAAARAGLTGINFTFLSEAEDRTVLLCSAESKRELLRRLTELPVDIGSVQRHRGATLEDVYMKVVGRG
ncbi:MAG TPA: ABC transporter ATP-binding protein [Terriglobia bacterium]|nr:ABC transporter ATP-binding protein [Terriglobia bacterium]